MNRFQQIKNIGLFCTTGILIGGGVLVGMLPAIAQGRLNLRLPDISAPGNRESGSTRSTTCIDPEDELISLVPESLIGLTQSAYPTIYFYLPPTTSDRLKFTLLNEATNELVYEGRFSIKNDKGITSVSLPNNGVQSPLEVGSTYVWYISVICDELNPDENVVVEGQIQRVEAISTSSTNPADLPALYASEGLWFDAIDASAKLKQEGNTADWNALLTAVDLDYLIPETLLTEQVVPLPQAASQAE